MLFLLRPITEEDERDLLRTRRQQQPLSYSQPEDNPEPVWQPSQPQVQQSAAAVKTVVRNTRKVGRNELCPCGSGKKI